MFHRFLSAIIGGSFAVLLLAACAGDSEDNSLEGAERERLAATAIANFNPDAPFTFQIIAPDGDTLSFSDEGLFRCFDPLQSIAIHSSRGTAPAIVSFEFPSETEPGTYDVVGSEDRAQGQARGNFTSFVRVNVGNLPGTGNYYQNISGQLTIEELAEAPQERVAGEFELTADTAEGALQIQGAFDFLSPENESFFCTGETGFFAGADVTVEPSDFLLPTAELTAEPDAESTAEATPDDPEDDD
ncbi:MAG: hypothetical protein ACLFTK_03365 [Anaerolineales bacterium]